MSGNSHNSLLLFICFRNVINSSLLNRRLILLIWENLGRLLYRLRHYAVNRNQPIIMCMGCDINIARVKEGEAVIGSAHIAAHVLL